MTKAYADSLSTGGGGGNNSTSITSADGTKKVFAANTAIQFQESGVTHLSIVGGNQTTIYNNYDLISSSQAVSNKLTFRSTGVPN